MRNTGSSALPQRYISLGDGEELQERPAWRLVCRTRANIGFDESRVRLPIDAIVQSGANLLGAYRVTFGEERRVQFEGYVHSARLNRAGNAVLIEARGWGHFLTRIHGAVKSHGVQPPEVGYNLAFAAGLDPSGVTGYSPTRHRYRITKAVKGLDVRLSHAVGGDVVEPLLGSSESAMIRALGLQAGAKASHSWAATTIASTGVDAPSFWEAIDFGSAELFETIALIQYQRISGDVAHLGDTRDFRFRPYWCTPNVSLSDPTLGRQLDDTKAMALSHPSVKRRAGRLTTREWEAAIERAASVSKALEALPRGRRDTLRNAVHLFVRAAEARDWPSALLFYSASADEIASLALRKRVLSRDDRTALARASELLFSRQDPRHKRVLELLDSANQRPFRDKLLSVAESCGIAFTAETIKCVEVLYGMRNQFAHAGSRPPSNIFYLFTTGLSVLDQLLSGLLPRASDHKPRIRGSAGDR